MVAPSLELVPLGGLGEVGMNCMTLACGEDMLIIDCGVTFPGGHLGVNIIHPDLQHIDQNRDRFRAVLITHGHEDHIGAMPFLIQLLGEDMPPVYAPPYAIELMKRRLAEFDHLPLPEFRPMKRRQGFGVGVFEVEPYRVNHSIVDSLGLILRTPAGMVVHSGDFKIEDAPPEGEAFDAERLKELGDQGVSLLLSDSTNIDSVGRAGNETDAAAAVSEIVGAATGRVVVAQFASNIYRMRGALEAAKKHHRKVVFLGRSVENHAFVARKLGHIRGFDSLLVSPESARAVPRDELLVIATGTQGEKPATLSRLARGEHRYLDLNAGDTVVLSSRIIPGQENSVYEMIDGLERRGVYVHHRRSDPGVHVSGHACREEQKTLMEWVRPRAFLPVHGTFHMLRAHAALAHEVGIPSVLFAENGTRVTLQNDRLTATGEVPTGRIHIARKEEVDAQMLQDRALISELGVAFVGVAIRDGRLVGLPEVEARGFLREELDDLCDDASDYIARDLRKHRGMDGPEAEDRARRALKRYFGRRLGRKPIAVAVAVELP